MGGDEADFLILNLVLYWNVIFFSQIHCYIISFLCNNSSKNKLKFSIVELDEVKTSK